jgi:hypothetical protein
MEEKGKSRRHQERVLKIWKDTEKRERRRGIEKVSMRYMR